MRKITQFDRASFNTLRPVLDEAIKKALAPYGLEGQVGGIKFENTSFTASLKVNTADNGRQSYLELVEHSKYRPESNRPKAEWFGETFHHRGDEYRIVGGKFGRRYDVQTTRVRDGQEYWFTSALVREAFEGKAAVGAAA